jgi:HK97 family phage portal protein
MAIVRSFGALQSYSGDAGPWWGPSGSPTGLAFCPSYGWTYATQPNVRTCVDFLARNVAQLGIHWFRRVSDTDRIHLVDHACARWLAQPNPQTTTYRLIDALMSDLGIYFNAFWLKVRYTDTNGRDAIGLVRIPPSEMRVEGALLPSNYCWQSGTGPRDFAPSEVIHFAGYNPLDGRVGLSPLDTLQRVLAEEAAAGEYRQQFWANAGRMEGIIERPASTAKWTPPQREAFRQQWQAYAGSGAKAGQTAVLEDGMSYKPIGFSAKDAEYLAGRKLTREECASAYMIPLPLVGILEHATFSNVKEQHKHLYQDTLGPWIEMIQQELERQLLPEAEDVENVYVEFNINAKLAGTLEERAQSIQLSTGRPWRTVNEARALENLPRIDDPELDTVAPQQGGPASNVAPPIREGVPANA